MGEGRQLCWLRAMEQPRWKHKEIHADLLYHRTGCKAQASANAQVGFQTGAIWRPAPEAEMLPASGMDGVAARAATVCC